MKSGGFGLGLGKKQGRSDEPKRAKPTNADLTALLSSSQKNPDKVFWYVWTPGNEPSVLYQLSVANCGAQRDRRGWSSNAIDLSAIGEAEWKLFKEVNADRQEIFSMKTSDSYLIITLIEEHMLGASPQGAAQGAMPAGSPMAGADSGNSFGAVPDVQQALQETPQATLTDSQVMKSPGTLPKEGNLKRVKIRTLLEAYNSGRALGRLICDIGTQTAEIFFADGEPVHAKSCHSIYQTRDTVGDAVLIELLTWKDGEFKFQEGWPAASRSITKPLSMFLSGEAAAAAAAAMAPSPAPAANPPSSAPAAPSAFNSPAPYAMPQLAPQMAGQAGSAPNSPDIADDFQRTEELIGQAYTSMIEPSGLLRYGMFLMLARTEFVRYERGRHPFCIATIGLHTANGAQWSNAALGKIGELFESGCQPLDIIAYAGGSRFFALFPQAGGAPTANVLRNFLTRIASTQLDPSLHGGNLVASVGLAEVPKDGADFPRIFDIACRLRRQATPQERLVVSAN